MYVGPDDCSDLSDDDIFSDDPDYEDYKRKVRSLRQEAFKNEQREQEDNVHKRLYNAILNGKSDEAKAILTNPDHKINVDDELVDKWNPLLLASAMGRADIVKELLDQGANVDVLRDKMTCLMHVCNCPVETASDEDCLEIVMLLTAKGINVNLTERSRRTALMFAAYNGRLDVVKFLLPLCDNKYVEDNQRWTALGWAVSGNNYDTVKLLLDEGFPVDTVDVRNYKPVDIAKSYGFEDIESLFPEDVKAESIDAIKQACPSEFEEVFMGDQSKGAPRFFRDVCDLLTAMKVENLARLLYDDGVGLGEFLAMNDSDLRACGVKMPYQRKRILAGLHRFHKRPFLQKSIPVKQRTQSYSTMDLAMVVVTTVKHSIIMEASLRFIFKNSQCFEVPGLVGFLKLEEVEAKIVTMHILTGILHKKFTELDRQMARVDLIKSQKRRRPRFRFIPKVLTWLSKTEF